MYGKSEEERKNKLTKDILYMKDSAASQIATMTKNGLNSHVRALKTFGPKSKVTKEALVTIREFYKISKLEGKLLNFILKNLDQMYLSAAEDSAMTLDLLNRSTIEAYQSVLTEINTACEEKDEKRVLKPEKGINSLLTNKRYTAMVMALTEKMTDVKSFLRYDEKFWNFISTYLKVVPVRGEGIPLECGLLPILDQEGNLDNFYTLIPKVVDFDTAIGALDVYKRAHDMYLFVGQPYKDYVKRNSAEAQLEYREHLEEKAQKVL